MKNLLLIFITLLLNGIVFSQEPYDPLKDTRVEKPANPALFLEKMKATKQLQILNATELNETEINALKADLDKANGYSSMLQLVATRNHSGNEVEMDSKFNVAKEYYYPIVWSKQHYSKYVNEEPRVGFYYFKTCYDLGRLLTKMAEYKNSYEFYTMAADFYKTDSSLYYATLAGMKGIENNEMKLTDYNGALFKMINKAIELKPGSGLYLRTRGELYVNHLKDTVKAISDFTKAIQLNPKDDKAYYNMAYVYYFQDKYSDAFKYITKCIQLNPKNGGYSFFRGLLYKDLKDYATAITDYTAAIILNNTEAKLYTDRGSCYVKLNNAAAAYDDYGFATMLNPKDEDSKEKLKKLDPFLKAEYEKMGFTPQNAYPFFLKIADTMYAQENYGPAVMNYQKCIQVQPKNPVPYNKAGLAFNILGMKDVAKQYLRYAAYADGKNPEYFVNLGDSYYDTKDFKTASGCYDTAALLGSKDALTYNYNGIIKQGFLKNFEGAIADYTKAIEFSPEWMKSVYLKRRANLYDELKNYKTALVDFELLVKLEPDKEAYKDKVKQLKEKLKE